jgi:hypothetical protein
MRFTEAYKTQEEEADNSTCCQHKKVLVPLVNNGKKQPGITCFPSRCKISSAELPSPDSGLAQASADIASAH